MCGCCRRVQLRKIAARKESSSGCPGEAADGVGLGPLVAIGTTSTRALESAYWVGVKLKMQQARDCNQDNDDTQEVGASWTQTFGFYRFRSDYDSFQFPHWHESCGREAEMAHSVAWSGGQERVVRT